MNVLFTNAGRRTYLIEYALRLSEEGRISNVCVSDSSLLTAAFWVDRKVKHFITPYVTGSEREYAEKLLELCNKNAVQIIIPLMDFELSVLASCRAKFLSEGIRIAISCPEVINRCLNKEECYQYCLSHGIRVPLSHFSLTREHFEKKMVLKRIRGSGSIGLCTKAAGERLNDFVPGRDMLQDCIEGQEYGMDILNDFSGDFLDASIRKKIAMRAGETDKAQVVKEPSLYALAEKISAAFRHVGNMDVDVIVDSRGEAYCIDLNPRFGGGYPFTHLSGKNYLGAVIDMAMGIQPSIEMAVREVVGVKGVSVHYVDKGRM